jgi:hypothetical protein
LYSHAKLLPKEAHMPIPTAPAVREIRFTGPFLNAVVHMIEGHLYSNYNLSSDGGDIQEQAHRYQSTLRAARFNAVDGQHGVATELFNRASFTGVWLLLRPEIDRLVINLQRDLAAMVDDDSGPGEVTLRDPAEIIDLVIACMEKIHELVAAVAAVAPKVEGAYPAPRILPHPVEDLRAALERQMAVAPAV